MRCFRSVPIPPPVFQQQRRRQNRPQWLGYRYTRIKKKTDFSYYMEKPAGRYLCLWGDGAVNQVKLTDFR